MVSPSKLRRLSPWFHAPLTPQSFYLADKTIAMVNTAMVTSNTLWPQRAMSPSMTISDKIPMIQFGARLKSRAPLWANAFGLLNLPDFGDFEKHQNNQSRGRQTSNSHHCVKRYRSVELLHRGRTMWVRQVDLRGVVSCCFADDSLTKVRNISWCSEANVQFAVPAEQA
jgi:hypothetical protein